MIARYSEFTGRDSNDEIKIQDRWYHRSRYKYPTKAAASSRHPPRQGSLLVEVAALPQAIMIGAALTAPEFFSEF